MPEQDRKWSAEYRIELIARIVKDKEESDMRAGSLFVINCLCTKSDLWLDENCHSFEDLFYSNAP